MRASKIALALLLSGTLIVMLGASAAWAAGDALEDLNNWYYPHAALEGDDWSDWDGWIVQGGAVYYDVTDDEGRFREDRFIDDFFSGGVQYMRYRDDNLEVIIQAVVEDLYGVEAHYVRPDAFRVDFEFTRHRKYYDGSNEAWDPTVYGMDARFADFPDEGFYADRVDLNLEATLLVPDLPNVSVGWHHWERFGDEVLLRGGRARNDPTGQPRRRSIPAVARLDGVSDTAYIEVPFTVADKHNISIRQEVEWYRDEQYIEFPRYRLDPPRGVNGIDEFRVYDDDPKWTEWRSLGHYDSFLSDNTYVSANYYHSSVWNETEREHRRLIQRNGSARNNIVNADTDLERHTDVLTLALALLNVAEHGKVQGAFRFESTRTDTDSFALQGPSGGPPAPAATDPLVHNADSEEIRLGESLDLVWKGVPNTTLSFEGEWEQRFRDEEALADVHTHELNTNFNPGPANLLFLDYEADVNHYNQEYTFTGVTRPRRDVRLTGRYRLKLNDRDLDVRRDNLIWDAVPGAAQVAALSRAYPYTLGDGDQDIHEVTFKGDWHFLPAWTGSVKYQYESNDIEYDAASTPSGEMDVHRVSGSVFGSPAPRVVVTAMGMYESYDMMTPQVVSPAMVAAGSDWAPGTGEFDYEYDALIFFGSGSWLISDILTGRIAYQHTDLNGSDVGNRLEEVWVGLDFALAENKKVQLKWEWFDFHDQSGKGFDDYNGHGISLAFACRF